MLLAGKRSFYPNKQKRVYFLMVLVSLAVLNGSRKACRHGRRTCQMITMGGVDILIGQRIADGQRSRDIRT
jgi:hypothetical protein